MSTNPKVRDVPVPGFSRNIQRTSIMGGAATESKGLGVASETEKRPLPAQDKKDSLKTDPGAILTNPNTKTEDKVPEKHKSSKTKQKIASFVVKDHELVKKVKAFAKEKNILIKDAYYLFLKKGGENYDIKTNPVDPLSEAEKALSKKKL